MISNHRQTIWFVTLGLSILPGCGDDGRVTVYPASGLVRVDDQPAAGVEIRLYPAEDLGNLDALRPYATTDAGGRFQLGTYEEADGAPVGRYKLTLFWPDAPPGPSLPNDRLGGRFANPQATEFEYSITEGENDLGTLTLDSLDRSRRPATAPGADADGFGGPPGDPS